METDWSVGQVLKAVEESGISGNTLVIFTADNGHSHYTGWEDLISAGHFPSGPYRGHKGDIWEGGHRVPLIVRWEGQIEAASSSDQLICLTDIYSTCQELVTGELPASDAGEDSFSFLDVLLNKDGATLRENIVNHSVNGEFAYRKDGWKIVFRLPEENLQASRGRAAEVELYNLNYDIAEANDSSQYYTDKVNSLTSELRSVVERGTSRKGEVQENDVAVCFDTIQKARWAAE
jgi:arylsulfatase A-like enzyme